jgi:hypothetical protein
VERGGGGGVDCRAATIREHGGRGGGCGWGCGWTEVGGRGGGGAGRGGAPKTGVDAGG